MAELDAVCLTFQGTAKQFSVENLSIALFYIPTAAGELHSSGSLPHLGWSLWSQCCWDAIGLTVPSLFLLSSWMHSCWVHTVALHAFFCKGFSFLLISKSDHMPSPWVGRVLPIFWIQVFSYIHILCMYVLSKSFKNFVNLVYEWFSFKIHAFHDPRNLWLNQVTKILSCVFFLKLYSVRRSCVCVSDPFESVHVHGLCRARLLLRVGTQLFLSLCLIWLLSLCGPLNLGWQWMCGWLYLLVYLYASTAAPGSLFWFPVTLAAPL